MSETETKSSDEQIQISTKTSAYTFSSKDIIGRGSFGVVYKGMDNYETPVAIKVMSKQDLGKEMDSTKLEIQIGREIATLNALSNYNNVIRILDSVMDDMNVYIIMEFCDGGSLEQFIFKNGALDWKKALWFLHLICEGLKSLHNNGVMHRDLKPSNILISDNKFKIADFGMASRNEFETSKVGTLLYMAPEIQSGKKYDKKVDIVSIGLIFAFMLLGSHPQKIESSTFSKFPDDVTMFLSSMIDPNPLKRPTASELSKRALHLFFGKNTNSQNSQKNPFEMLKSPSNRNLRIKFDKPDERLSFRESSKNENQKEMVGMTSLSQKLKVIDKFQIKNYINQSLEEKSEEIDTVKMNEVIIKRKIIKKEDEEGLVL